MLKYETNSKLVKSGQIFVAIKGHTVDAHDFIPEAVKNGASQIIASREVECSIPVNIVSDTEKYLKERLVEEYADKLNEMKFIGVTGTNGKTTTCYLTYQLLNQFGLKTAYLGTVGFYFNNEVIELNNTTPDILTLYKLLLDAKEKGAEYVVMEVSSHALALERIAGLKYDVGAFTNLTQDHLDFHSTMDEYLEAKLKLVSYLKDDGLMILNGDDKASARFLAICKSESVGLKGDYKVNNYATSPDSTIINFTYDNNKYEVKTNLTSHFNVYNYLMALAIVKSLGLSINDIISKTCDIYPPKGRCETIKVKGGYAVVDFAHTPDAVEKVIAAYNELKQNRVITIVGCGGDRDPKKRPIMGNIATANSDYVIFTNDNPRTEDPQKIMDDIIKDNKSSNYEIIFDRREAIYKGLDMLESEDILLVLGKGHENYQIIGREKVHFDDAEEIKNYNS